MSGCVDGYRRRNPMKQSGCLSVPRGQEVTPRQSRRVPRFRATARGRGPAVRPLPNVVFEHDLVSWPSKPRRRPRWPQDLGRLRFCGVLGCTGLGLSPGATRRGRLENGGPLRIVLRGSCRINWCPALEVFVRNVSPGAIREARWPAEHLFWSASEGWRGGLRVRLVEASMLHLRSPPNLMQLKAMVPRNSGRADRPIAAVSVFLTSSPPGARDAAAYASMCAPWCSRSSVTYLASTSSTRSR